MKSIKFFIIISIIFAVFVEVLLLSTTKKSNLILKETISTTSNIPPIFIATKSETEKELIICEEHIKELKARIRREELINKVVKKYKLKKLDEDKLQLALEQSKYNELLLKDFNDKMKVLQKYDKYIYIDKEVKGWTIDEFGQKIAYEYSNGDANHYIMNLSFQYAEGCNNKNNIINYNDNGTVDIGCMQINCKVTDTKKIKLMQNRKINLEEGFYIINQILENCEGDWAQTIISYNGGYKSRDMINAGIWTLNCQAGQYLQYFYKIYCQVYNAYMEQVSTI